ncbi:hypothetical protein [Streptomyces sp. NPDC096339]|uniref:hypothetical protein n=1 Tax=Streptomyces sp. NPDC096339 TaxID=3366086 RepID=UPI00381120A7
MNQTPEQPQRNPYAAPQWGGVPPTKAPLGAWNIAAIVVASVFSVTVLGGLYYSAVSTWDRAVTGPNFYREGYQYGTGRDAGNSAMDRYRFSTLCQTGAMTYASRGWREQREFEDGCDDDLNGYAPRE